MDKSSLAPFLAANPFPRPLTDGLFYREKMRAIHRIAPDSLGTDGAPARILEIGGGRSGLASLLYPGASITTLDRNMAELGKDGATARSAYVCADACRLPFADGSFDAVTLFDVLEHIPEDATAAQEARRVVRPGGWVLLSTPNLDWHYPVHGVLAPWCPPETDLMTEWGHVRRGYDRASLAALFDAPPERSATFINRSTAWFHDIAFSRLGERKRRLLYGLAAPVAWLGYVLHRSTTDGTETAFAWRQS